MNLSDGLDDDVDGEEGSDVVEMDDSDASDANERDEKTIPDEKDGVQGIKASKALATIDLTTQQNKGMSDIVTICFKIAFLFFLANILALYVGICLAALCNDLV